MSTHHSNVASGLFDNVDTGDWGKRTLDAVRTVFEAMATGRKAAHDYRRLSAHHQPQEAIQTVFKTHFSKR
ncbi:MULTISPECIES: hypothetical protein [Rhodomicrobium]|uniref:hypothetical protein n=1 Tax=Rhodomicrobium TaxID=1068 RepID=UPI000F73C0DF|nr:MULTISPECIES: hypothetical protein [Rhodomicrobium]